MGLESPAGSSGAVSSRRTLSGRAGGPVPVPRRRQGVPLVGWIVVGLVVAFSLVVYVATRQYPPSPLNAQPPSWGALTLTRIALNAARRAGDARPEGAVWVSTARMYAVPYLTGRASDDAEADFLVALQGRFHTPSASPVVLPGSLAHGTRLVLLVRGFDGHITGLMVTDRPLRHLRGLGLVHPLPLGLGVL